MATPIRVTLFSGEKGAARLEANGRPIWSGSFADTVGFAAAKIIRRIFGLAHNIDFELIEDPRCGRSAKPAACSSRGK